MVKVLDMSLHLKKSTFLLNSAQQIHIYFSLQQIYLGHDDDY